MKNLIVDCESRAAYICFSIAQNCQGLAHMELKEDWEIKHHCTTGIIFTAFSIEAMINHFGKVMFQDEWESKRQCRKKQHGMLFDAVNLPNYLGTTNYQIAKKCFEVRDIFAHGKTNDENLELTDPPKLSTKEKELVRKVMDEPTSMQSLISIEELDKYIETAQKIENDIQEHGYYPNQEHLPHEERERLHDYPLSVSGIRKF